MRFLPLIAITVAPLFAQVDVDKTCATCDRRQLDSLNLLPRAIRVNQVGYLPADPNKAAFVANPSAPQFSLVDARTRKAVFTGPLKSSGTFTEGAMRIRGGYNSIIDLYNFSRPASAVALHRADFSAFTEPGEFVLACGKDTSAAFRIDGRIYNQVFETSLKFFGSNRCGNTHSWIHKACHLKDGDALGAARAGSLAGGWHDCGDHGKYSETVAYAAVALAATYAFYPEKGEDFYGKSYNDTLPFGTDGVPDVLYEAKIGADYILKLYKASVADGLIAKGDMYHSVGMGPGMDHQYWDVPDHQDVQPQSKGGPARPVTAGIGSNVAGMYAAALAFFAWGWEPFDPAYAKECLAAATVLYDKIVMARRGSSTKMPCCYTGGGPTVDDEGLAALALWFATKEKRFGFDLIGNPALGTSGTAQFNQGEFPAGIMAKVPYHHGGWTTDYQNTYAYVLYGLAKLIVNTPAHAAPYGIDAATADSLKRDALAALRNSITIGSNGSTTLPSGIRADPPYNGVFTSADWGFNRYNLGLVTEIFMYWDLTKDKEFYNIGVDNLNYNLGMNPWDISFIMGAGDKNLQHPHNRAANPEGYNAGGLPYKYQSPKGALMGGCRPGDVLIDDWEKYVNTETCIDFSSQLLIPAQLLAQDLPPDNEGPKFRNVNIFPEDRSALVTWATDEISRDSVYLLDAPGGKVLQALPGSGLAKAKQATFTGLTPNTSYWIYFKGEDIRRNVTVDRNGGEYWKFTTKASAVAAQISDIRVCNETHESALVTWWTRNGEYQSQVDYGKTTALGLSQSPDDMGVPTRFHRVTLRELEPATQYFFQTVSGATKDDNGGRMHTLKTTQVLVDYTIRIKPTNKASGGKSAHFYLDVTNHEAKAYTGLELRVYFSADAATAADLVAQGFDNQVFDVGGVPSMLDIAYGKAAPVPGMTGIWYFPITLKSTLPVAGRARFELQVNRSANGGFALAPFSLFKDAWSLRAHKAPPDPVAFEGVDLSKGENGVYIGPEMVEKVNGENVLTYQEDPFITAYYQGVHVYGYGPDYLADPLVYQRTMHLELTAPVVSPVDRLDLRRETDTVTLAGKAWVDPDGRVDKLIINGVDLEKARLVRTGGAVAFTFPAKLQEGANTFDIIAWDTAHCAVESRKLIVNWKKGPPIPPAQAVKPKADPPGRAGRDSVVVGLTSSTVGAAIWYSLDGSVPGAGAAGSILYAGPLVIKSQATLKAIAVAPGFSPSEIMVETYDVFPFRVANVAAVTARDGDGDGHADFVEALLDTALGAPAAAVAGPQADAARFNNGFTAAGSRLAADSLRILLAANTVRVRHGRDSLTLPPPATLQDGMLRPGTYPIRDGIAPVLRKAVLLRGLGGAPDTLLAVFSEPLRADRLGPKPLAGLRGGDETAYTFGLGPAQAATLPGTQAGEQAYRFTILGVAGTAGAVVPLTGDWVRIDPAGGASDSLGNVQLNPLNAKVPLQIRIALAYTIRLAAADGITRPGTEAPKAEWSADGGPNVGPVIGEPGASLPTIRASGGPGALVVESTMPFSIHLRVHSTLGEYLSQARLKVGDRDFALLPSGSSPGSRKLVLIWNGKAANGQMAGTGAYVHVWHVTFFPADEAPRRNEGKATFGLLR